MIGPWSSPVDTPHIWQRHFGRPCVFISLELHIIADTGLISGKRLVSTRRNPDLSFLVSRRAPGQTDGALRNLPVLFFTYSPRLIHRIGETLYSVVNRQLAGTRSACRLKANRWGAVRCHDWSQKENVSSIKFGVDHVSESIVHLDGQLPKQQLHDSGDVKTRENWLRV